ncbi:hypothetical protein D3C72_535090 [compost metagenome]
MMKSEIETALEAGRNTRRSEKMRGNLNAARGFPTKKNFDRYPIDGLPLACDLCAVAHKCKKYEAGAVCAYRKDVTRWTDTRDLDAVINELEALAAAQRGRVQVSMLFESIMGGQPNRETGRNIDRLMAVLALIAKLRKLQGDRGAELNPNGIFAKLFGENPEQLLPPAS